MADDDVAARIARQARWDVVYEGIFNKPTEPERCPFCGQLSVRSSWVLFAAEPRTASMDVWCERCGEKEHAAVLLPEGTADCFPPGVRKLEAEGTARIFDVGRKRDWW